MIINRQVLDAARRGTIQALVKHLDVPSAPDQATYEEGLGRPPQDGDRFWDESCAQLRCFGGGKWVTVGESPRN